jgi:hypothetical protein
MPLCIYQIEMNEKKKAMPGTGCWIIGFVEFIGFIEFIEFVEFIGFMESAGLWASFLGPNA